MTKVIFIVGLPGSGKSIYGQNLAAELKAEYFDDFKGGAILNCNHFPFARRYVELINRLLGGEICVISDIDFCRDHARAEAEACLMTMVPGVVREWVFFDNNAEQCRINISDRARVLDRDLDKELEKLHNFSAEYNIPANSMIIPVYSQSRNPT